jgi:arginase family enzyme
LIRKIPWYESKLCVPESLPENQEEVDRYFFPDGKREPYWVSFDIDGVDYQEFASTGTPENKGIPIDFMMKFFETFLPDSVGMDLTEVNFRLSSGNKPKKIKEL